MRLAAGDFQLLMFSLQLVIDLIAISNADPPEIFEKILPGI